MFNKTLYYPWIDIHDDSWVKTAILYWDEINTIVPFSMANPYRSKVANLLAKERILRPFEVTPNSREVQEASDIALQYLGTPEGLRLLNAGGEPHRLHPGKMSYMLKSKLGLEQSRLHHGKMMTQLMDTISSARIDDDGFVNIDGKFSAYYMSALANRIANNNNLSTVADSKVYNQFNTKLTANGYVPQRDRAFIRCPRCREQFDRFTQEIVKNTGQCPLCQKNIFYFYEPHYDHGTQFNAEPRHLVDGLLADIVIQSIYIPNTVDVEKLLRFRQDHNDELSCFRGALQDITNSILDCGEVEDIRALRQRVSVAFKDRVQPEIKCLKSQLKSNKINYLLSDFSIGGMASLVGTTMGTTIGTVPLLIAAGASICVSSIMYRSSRNNIKTNPYSYVLSMEKKLTR